MREFVKAFQTDMLAIWKLFVLWFFSVFGAIFFGTIVHMWLVLILWK